MTRTQQQRTGFFARLFGPLVFGTPSVGTEPLLLAASAEHPAAPPLAYSTERPKRWDRSRGFLGNVFGPVVFMPPSRVALPPPSADRAPALPRADSRPPIAPPPIAPPIIPPVAPPASEQTDPAITGPETPPVVEPPVPFFLRLREGLTRSSSRLAGGINSLLTERKLDSETLEDLEDLLITADLGADTAGRLVADLSKNRFGKQVTPEEVRTFFAEGIARILEPVARPLEIDATLKPHVILVVGVNGSGKTTTIGKIANQLTNEGKSVMLAAGDTFRAAAVEQLKVWGDRTGSPVIARDTGADAAGLAFDALEQARAAGADVLLIDTAGRLHNKTELMEELKKVVRVLRKLDPDVPHTVLQVLDATVGQNAHQQVKVFGEMVDVSGLVMTKLDGTAKGGVVVSLADKFNLPVHYVGVGEGATDLRSFRAQDFARSLMGLEKLH